MYLGVFPSGSTSLELAKGNGLPDEQGLAPLAGRARSLRGKNRVEAHA
jgi:hypothetical protein